MRLVLTTQEGNWHVVATEMLSKGGTTATSETALESWEKFYRVPDWQLPTDPQRFWEFTQIIMRRVMRDYAYPFSQSDEDAILRVMTTEPAAGQVLRWFQLLEEGQFYEIARQMSRYPFPTAVHYSANPNVTRSGSSVPPRASVL